jgi:hypothetical protein
VFEGGVRGEEGVCVRKKNNGEERDRYTTSGGVVGGVNAFCNFLVFFYIQFNKNNKIKINI